MLNYQGYPGSFAAPPSGKAGAAGPPLCKRRKPWRRVVRSAWHWVHRKKSSAQGKNMGKWWKTLENMGNIWEKHGKHMGNIWEAMGKNMGNGGKIRIYCENIIEYSWEYTIMEYCTGILMDITAGNQTWLAEKSSLNGCFNKNINYWWKILMGC